MIDRKVSLIAALMVAVAPFAVQAQDLDLDREPSVGKVFTGRLDDGGNPVGFLLTQAAGEGLDLTAMPVAGSDPYLRVYDARSGELIAENDDSNGSLAANVRLYSETARRLRIEVSGAVGDTGGMRFDLVLRPSDFRPAPVRDILAGESFSGSIQSQGEQLFRFRAAQGQQWEFSMVQGEGSGLDPFLTVYRGERAVGTPIAEDDDGGDDLNARLHFSAPSAGTYVVRASGVRSTAGAYTFSAGPVLVARPAELRELALGRPASGALDSLVRERFYRLDAPARAALVNATGSLVVEMRRVGGGNELDPVLEVGFDTPLGFSVLRSDDDGGGDMNAMLELDASTFTPEWLETLRIKAGAYSDTAGDYELMVSVGER